MGGGRGAGLSTMRRAAMRNENIDKSSIVAMFTRRSLNQCTYASVVAMFTKRSHLIRIC